MFRDFPTLIGPLAVAVLVATLVANSPITQAKEKNARVKSFSFSASQLVPGQSINVVSSTGERWDRIAAGDISLRIGFKMKLAGRNARVQGSGLFLGGCHKTLCGGNPLIRVNPVNPTILSTNQISVSRSGIATVPYGAEIIKACNQYLNGGPSSGHQFTHPITVTLSVNTRRGRKGFIPANPSGNFNGGDVSRQSTFRVNVKCIPYASLIRGSDPVEIKLEATPRNGNSCPRNTTIKTRIVYHYDRNVKFDILRNGKKIKTVGLKPTKVNVSHGPDLWVINRQDAVKAKAGQNRFRIKVRGGGESQVKTVNIECAPFQPLFANLQYNVAGGNYCPKKVWETTTFSANGPGSLVYQLVQENGSVALEKSVNSILKNGQYKLVKQRVLTIHNSIDRKYRVQVKGSSGIRSSWARLKVDCPPPVDQVNPASPKRIKIAPTPKKDASKKRRVKIIEPPKRVTQLICKKGKVRAGRCYCGAKRKRVRIGRKAFMCTKRPTVKIVPQPKKARTICRGGVAKGQRCVCSIRTRPVRIGAHKYKCVAKKKARVNRHKGQRANPSKRRRNPAVRRCGPRKVFLRGRCIRRTG